jgi:VWFA-related protein
MVRPECHRLSTLRVCPMTRTVLVVTLLASLTGVGQQTPEQARPAGQLQIDVSAVDKNGLPVTDLRPQEFEVWIGPYRIPIDTVTVVTPESAGSDRTTVLILDDLTISLDQMARIRDVARRFVNRMAPGDRLAVTTFNATAAEFTSDRAKLLKRVDDFNIAASGAVRLEDLGERFLDLLKVMSKQLQEFPSHRKTFVAIGSSWLFDAPLPPPIAGRDLAPQWIDAMRAMAAAHSSLYVIDPGGVGARPVHGRGFADQTGGAAFVNTNNFDDAVDRIMAETVNYYILSVADPTVKRGAPLRELDVRVLRKGVTVHARRAILGAQ